MPRRTSRVEATIQRLAAQDVERKTAALSDKDSRRTSRAKARQEIPPTSHARLMDMTERAGHAPPGVFKVDELGLSWGRAVLVDAARAGARAVWRHAMDADRFDRDADLRAALTDAISAMARARELANLLVDLHRAGEAYEREAWRVLAGETPRPKGRGSPGRPVHDAVSKAVNERWAHETGRYLPLVLDRDRHADLIALRMAISEDIFENANAIGGPGRRPPNK